MRSLVRSAFWAAGLCLLLLGWILFHSRDLPAVNEVDLAPALSESPHELNGAVRLVQAVRVAAWPRGDVHPRLRALRLYESWDADSARAVLGPNEAALAEVSAGLDAPRFDVNTTELMVEHPALGLSLYVAWTDLARLLALRSALYLADAEQDAAFAAALDVMRLGDRIQRADSPALEHAVLGLGIKTVGLEQLLALVPRASLSSAEALAISRELERTRSDAETWARIFAGEYQAQKETFRWGLRAGSGLVQLMPSAYLVHSNRTLNVLADHFRRFQRNAAVPCAAMEQPAPSIRPSRWARVFSPNSGGDNLMHVARPNFDGFQRRRCGVETLTSAVQSMVALRAHRELHSELPANLEALVPTYLDGVPVCGYVGEPLGYSRNERALYSHAPNAPFHISF